MQISAKNVDYKKQIIKIKKFSSIALCGNAYLAAIV